MAANNIEAALMTTHELCQYLSMGKPQAQKFGEAAGARIKFGRSVRWNKAKIDEYLRAR